MNFFFVLLISHNRPPLSALLLVRAVMRLDDEIRSFAGSTMVFVIAERRESTVDAWIVNLGDSRCIALHPGGSWTPLSMDHKTTVPEEAARAQKVGAQIINNRIIVTVQSGALNLTRSLGDHKFKSALVQPPHRQAISPVPDVIFRTLGLDDILVLGSDGLFDGLGSDGVAFFINSTMEEGGSLADVISDLVDTAMVSKDNVSALALRFFRSSQVNLSRSPETADFASRPHLPLFIRMSSWWPPSHPEPTLPLLPPTLRIWKDTEFLLNPRSFFPFHCLLEIRFCWVSFHENQT